MPADLHVADAPFLDQPSGETGGRAEQLGDLVDGQVAVGRHAVGSPSVPGAGSRDAASQASARERPVPANTQWPRTRVVSVDSVSTAGAACARRPSARG